jgi:hypothetical protein
MKECDHSCQDGIPPSSQANLRPRGLVGQLYSNLISFECSHISMWGQYATQVFFGQQAAAQRVPRARRRAAPRPGLRRAPASDHGVPSHKLLYGSKHVVLGVAEMVQAYIMVLPLGLRSRSSAQIRSRSCASRLRNSPRLSSPPAPPPKAPAPPRRTRRATLAGRCWRTAERLGSTAYGKSRTCGSFSGRAPRPQELRLNVRGVHLHTTS